MLHREGEFSIAIMEPGTLCVLMVGVPVDKRLELSVRVLAMIPLNSVNQLSKLIPTIDYSVYSVSVSRIWPRDNSNPPVC